MRVTVTLPMGNGLNGRPEWQAESDCQDHLELYQGMMDRVVVPEKALVLGKAICRSCRVNDECYDFAMTEPAVEGMFAGLYGKELNEERKLFKKRRQSRSKKIA